MRNLKKLLIGILISLCGIGLASTGATFAWLMTANTYLEMDNAKGNVIANYFDSGDGSENTPFVIANETHLHNLTELCARHDSFAAQGYYFELKNDIDADYYKKFRPIGSETRPFKGHFDGKGYIIENLHISGEGVSDIGIFGYVDDIDENTKTTIENTYFEDVDINITGAVSNGHAAHSATANVGYIAGHIKDATYFSDVYINNCDITGTGVDIKNDWGYFGECENAEGIEQFIATATNNHTHGDNWGGSIDFKEFNRRFYNRRNLFTYSSKKLLATYQTDYTKASLAYGSDLSTNILNKDPDTNTSKIVYNLQGSGSHTINNKDTMTLVGTAMPLSIESNGVTADSNTGYVVSSSRSTSGAANGAVRTASYRNGYLNNSLTDTAKTPRQVYTAGSNNGELLTYNSSKTEILTNKNKSYNANGSGTDNFILISDDYNSGHTPANSYLTSYTKSAVSELGFKKYTSSRQALDDVLSGTQKVHGIHFMNATISNTNTETLPTVKFNGQTYTNSSFPLLRNCIDFKTKTNGVINFFGGTYYDHTVSGQYVSSADCFFSLSVVERAADNSISDVKLISSIYKDNRSDNAYIYKYGNGRYSDNNSTTKSANVGDIVFDMQYLSATPPVQNALYYFEIPVDAGEFALGGVSGQDAGAYLIYLDISATESGSTTTQVDDFKSVEYRSTPDKTEHSILLITYIQTSGQTADIEVVYENNTYTITYDGTITTKLVITRLDSTSTIIFNNYTLPTGNGSIGSYNCLNSPPTLINYQSGT